MRSDLTQPDCRAISLESRQGIPHAQTNPCRTGGTQRGFQSTRLRPLAWWFGQRVARDSTRIEANHSSGCSTSKCSPARTAAPAALRPLPDELLCRPPRLARETEPRGGGASVQPSRLQGEPWAAGCRCALCDDPGTAALEACTPRHFRPVAVPAPAARVGVFELPMLRYPT